MAPIEFLRVAIKIMDERQGLASEAESRISAHASYYAVYHLLVQHMQLADIRYADRKHSMIDSILRGHRPSTSVTRAGLRYFRTLLNLRVRADYVPQERFAVTDAEHAIDCAIEVFAAAGQAP
ncbi:HEPN domain-containing protein [Elioraea rosea]|uniref:HEPN domain-containing protein n=1 Tax=Elioraea rosea TaxID=2492390 RepID=UPI0023B7FAB7|nr:HEPN domain-containing protein [Elioraea rosea]